MCRLKRGEMPSQGRVGSAPLLRSRYQLSSLVRSVGGRAMMFQVEAQQEQRHGSDTWEWQVIWYCWVPGRGRASGWRGGVGRRQTAKVPEAIRGPVGWGGFGAARGTAPGVR